MKALKNISTDDVVFLDIETVAATPNLELSTGQYVAWAYKMQHSKNNIPVNLYEKEYLSTAALYPEFAKIVCITIGKIKDGSLKLKSYYSHDEKELLTDFTKILNGLIANNKQTVLCGFAIKGFDIPFIMRRCLVNQIQLPSLIDVSGEKPWTITTIDLKELWQGTSFNTASLIAVAHTLGLVNPKDDIEGAQTTETYYANPDTGLERIRIYCEKDVLTTANIFCKCKYEPIVTAEITDFKEKPVGVLEKAFNTGGQISKQEQDKLTKVQKALKGKKADIGVELLNIALNTKK